MATLNEISYNILNKMSGGRAVNSPYISLDQIKFNVNYYRALLLHRDMQKDILHEDAFYQTLEVATELVSADLHKTVARIPKLIRLNHKYPIRVDADGVQIPIINEVRRRYRSFDRFTPDQVDCYLKDGYLYITTVPTTLEITGMFENPSEAYIAAGNDPEVVDDMHYPISQDVLQRLSTSLIKGDFELFLTVPPDVTQDNLPTMQK